MIPAPDTWFEVLGVDLGDVARVGYSLAEYADEHEAPRLEQSERSVEEQLMLATTITEAATLLVLVDTDYAAELLLRAANLFEAAGAPEAWVLGMACGNAWRPESRIRSGATLERPSDGMSSLVALNAYLEQAGEGRESAWAVASGFGDNLAVGWSATGVPARLFAEFSSTSRERDLDGTVRALDSIVDRSDEVLRAAQEGDRWRWQRFIADVPLIDPELLALGCVASKVDATLIDEAESRRLSPGRVALLAGMRLGEGPADEQVPLR